MPPPAATTRRRGRARKAPAFHLSVFHSMEPPWEPWDRDWAELPADTISCVLHKLSLVELLLGGVAEVCRSWRRAAREEPELWRRVDVRHVPHVPPFTRQATLENIMAAALRLSAGQCHTFLGEHIGDDLLLLLLNKAPSLKNLHLTCRNDPFSKGGLPSTIRKLPLLETFHGNCINGDFFTFLAEKAPSLKKLHLVSCGYISDEVFANAIKKFPLLEDLEFDDCLQYHLEDKLELIAKACRYLKHLTLVQKRYGYKQRIDDRKALTIARRMHGLHSLKLAGDNLSNEGLTTIIDNCPHLEYLQIRDCCNINMDYSLTAKCARIFMDYDEYFPPSLHCRRRCSSPISRFDDSADYHSDDDHDLSLYSYLGDDIDGTDLEEHERTLDVKSMRRYLS